MGQENNHTATVLGTIGTVFWCVQLIPQIWYNWRRKKTEGLPAAMGFLWAGCAVPMESQSFFANSTPDIGFFFNYHLGTDIILRPYYTRMKATMICCGMLALLGGLEALLILTLRIPYQKGITWPDLLVGIVAAIMLEAGLLPVYFEFWKRNGRVVGFNWAFLCIDILGGLFSLFALAAEGSFDILGGIIYIIVVVLEMDIYISHTIWRYRF